jgi:transglutaminase-like putative cysteine protease
MLRLGFVGANPQDSKVETLPLTDNGLDAVRQTLKKMAALVRRYSSDVTTGTTARDILRMGGISDIRKQKQARASVTLLQNWVRDSIAYVYDPVDVEWIQTPPRTLSCRTGDCDDKSILLNAMLASVGFQTQFLAVGGSGPGWGGDGNPSGDIPGEYESADGAPLGHAAAQPPFSHVLSSVKLGSPTGRRPWYLDGWLPLETIVPGAEPGWLPPGIEVILPWRV